MTNAAARQADAASRLDWKSESKRVSAGIKQVTTQQSRPPENEGIAMRSPFTVLVRVTTIGLLSATVIVIGLAGNEPRSTGPRIARTQPLMGVDGHFGFPRRREAHVIDPETGRTAPLTLPKGDWLLEASVAPWHDVRGESQVVGHWVHRHSQLWQQDHDDYGIARYTYPGGHVLNYLSTELVPGSPPCWFPDSSTRILFTAWNGGLYRLTFEEPGAPEAGVRGSVREPERLPWHAEPLADRQVWMTDPTWPADPQFGGRVFVALRHLITNPEGSKYGPLQIWWLRLGSDVTEIVDVGRATSPGSSSNSVDAAGIEVEERCPALFAGSGGTLLLAYLAHMRNQMDPSYQLRVAPVALTPATAAPVVDMARSRVLAEHALPIAPVFSSDGSSIVYIEHVEGSQPQVRRVAIEPFVPTPDEAILPDEK
jgi:hypothetical protein